MLITIDELLNSGLPISSEIEPSRLQMAIDTAEVYIVRSMLGDAKYIEIINNPTEYDVVINGGIVGNVFLVGLKKALYHFAYGNLLRDNIVSTSFGVNLKKDEYSTIADEEQIRKVGQYHSEVGRRYVMEVCKYLNIEVGKINDYWSEY